MKLILLSDESVRLEMAAGPMTIEALAEDQSYSPFHMMAGALAYCTWSVLHSWATHAKLGADDLALEVAWEFAEKPHRVGAYDVHFSWPSLPLERLDAAKRVAEMCTVHTTLTHPPTITIDGSLGSPATEHEQADGAEPESERASTAA